MAKVSQGADFITNDFACFVDTSVNDRWRGMFKGMEVEFSGHFMPMPVFRDAKINETMTYFMSDHIIRAVSDVFGISKYDLLSRRRLFKFAHPRQMAMYICAQRCRNLSLGQIGKALGGRDHTTVIHGIKQAEKRFNESEEWRQLYGLVLAKLEKLRSAT